MTLDLLLHKWYSSFHPSPIIIRKLTMQKHLTVITLIITLFYALPLSAVSNMQIVSNWFFSLFFDNEHNEAYRTECGNCHFAYQPHLLPARSWQELITTLNEHFGDNIKLETEVQITLTDYLTENAADFSDNELAKKLLQDVAKVEVPVRITRLPYFVHEHDDLSRQMVNDNPKVKSMIYCDKCHLKAEIGSYVRNEINVPGYGIWNEYRKYNELME